MAVDGKVELFMAVHVDGIVIAGSDERREYFHVAIVVKFRTNNDGKLTWYIYELGCQTPLEIERWKFRRRRSLRA